MAHFKTPENILYIFVFTTQIRLKMADSYEIRVEASQHLPSNLDKIENRLQTIVEKHYFSTV